MSASWRGAADRYLREVFDQLRADGVPATDTKEIDKRIFNAYPWGIRKYSPYKIWLEQVKRWKAGYAAGLMGPLGGTPTGKPRRPDPAQEVLL
jgi:hypothetical protein